jgi:hypothetical protein
MERYSRLNTGVVRNIQRHKMCHAIMWLTGYKAYWRLKHIEKTSEFFRLMR